MSQILKKIGFLPSLNTNIEIGQTRKILCLKLHDRGYPGCLPDVVRTLVKAFNCFSEVLKIAHRQSNVIKGALT